MSIIKTLRNFFIPSKKNNFRGRSLHTDFLTYYLIGAIFLSVLYKGAAIKNFGSHVLGVATDIRVTQLFEETNQERVRQGRKPLKYSQKLSEAALAKAEDMMKDNYWAHYSPSGKTPWDFIMSSKYQYELAGENLAKDFMTSQGVLTALMASPTHRANILKDGYADVGFAVVSGHLQGEDTTLVVQMFGKPLNAGDELAQSDTLPSEKTEQPKSNGQEIAQAGPVTRILAETEEKKPLINLKKISFDFSFLIFSGLILFFAIDLVYAWKLGVIRRTGRHLAHFVFLGVLLTALFFATKGLIL